MTNNYINENFYNCGSEGVCTINPVVSAIQEILLLYLVQSANYALKLKRAGINYLNIKNLILNTISSTVTNLEISETDFLNIVSAFWNELPNLIREYEKVCEENNIQPEYAKPSLKRLKKSNITALIRFGEKEFQKKQKIFSEDIRNLHKILFLTAKNICVHIQDLQTFGIDSDEEYTAVLEVLNSIQKEKECETIKKYICKFAQINKTLSETLHTQQENVYGKQRSGFVSYTTTPSKAVLVVGSNIRELENILDALKDTDIDVYTHDKMILAHTFPKFSEYKNLKGHYGQVTDSYMPDFATFPGPIILTRHSLFNIGNLYRGRLYTTDFACSKGIISIKNNDFSEVINSANNSKGFKTGKICSDEVIGYDFEKLSAKISEKISAKNYSSIAIIENSYNVPTLTEYFNIFLKKAQNNILFISLSPQEERENLISVNACFDNYAIFRFSDFVKNILKKKLIVFFQECNSNFIPTIIYLKSKYNADIFIGKSNPLILSPSCINVLCKLFNIQKITTPVADLNKII